MNLIDKLFNPQSLSFLLKIGIQLVLQVFVKITESMICKEFGEVWHRVGSQKL